MKNAMITVTADGEVIGNYHKRLDSFEQQRINDCLASIERQLNEDFLNAHIIMAKKHKAKRVKPYFNRRLKPAEDARRMKFYKQGLSDKEIAMKTKLSIYCIRSWRNARGLPANVATKVG